MVILYLTVITVNIGICDQKIIKDFELHKHYNLVEKSNSYIS